MHSTRVNKTQVFGKVITNLEKLQIFTKLISSWTTTTGMSITPVSYAGNQNETKTSFSVCDTAVP